ncbi:hypothetical protein R6L23_10765, partial [Streptomyces sp. SR27]|nr:hypothetical protein [Streptomyces sp. SR27]
AGAPAAPRPLDEGGRGLLLVEALASRWEVLDRVPVGKTVRAELDFAPCADSADAAVRLPPD